MYYISQIRRAIVARVFIAVVRVIVFMIIEWIVYYS